MPLRLRDAGRAEILCRSLDWFFPELDRLWIVTSRSERATLAEAFETGRQRVVCEDDVVPCLRRYRRLSRATGLLRRRPQGWYVQQLIKLAAPGFVTSDHYLTLDSDVFLVRPVAKSDLLRAGRSGTWRYQREEHPDWYEWTFRVLGLKQGPWSHGVTPLLYSVDGMRVLHEELEAVAHPALRLASSTLGLPRGNWVTGWSAVLLRNVPWAEQALYHVLLERRGLYDQYHFDLAAPLCDRGVWSPGAFDRWDPAPAFADGGPFFSIVQSWLGIEPERVWQRIEPLMGAAREAAR